MNGISRKDILKGMIINREKSTARITVYDLDISEIINIQKEQLDGWKKVLKPKMFSRLSNYCYVQNSKLIKEHGIDSNKGNLVFRGNDLDMFVKNNLILENNLYKE